MAKRKMTPFARFFIALMIIAPLAFITASYINGEDPVKKIKEVTGIEAEEGVERTEKTVRMDDKSLEAVLGENKSLKKDLEARDQEIESLKRQLSDCKSGTAN
jgi:predicted RNase H-like nuclease (RuvC/YqgF family)